MCISVGMTIHIIIGFFHAHICTNDYPYYCRFLLCTSLCELISILFFVFIVHISLRMNIHIIFGYRHAHLYMNDYLYCFIFLSCTSLY